MITPNRLSAPGERAARERVEALYARVDELGPADIAGLVIRPRDPDERENLLDGLERAAHARGLGPLLVESRRTVREALLARFAAELPPGTFGVSVPFGSRPEDRVALVAAVEDAVAVAVAQDAIDPDDAATLADPGRRILGLPTLAAPGVDAGDHRPAWEPTSDDWAEAAVGGAAVDHGVSPPGTRALRALFCGAAAVVGVPLAIAWGLAEGAPLLGVLGAAAVLAVCWTLATWRRPT